MTMYKVKCSFYKKKRSTEKLDEVGRILSSIVLAAKRNGWISYSLAPNLLGGSIGKFQSIYKKHENEIVVVEGIKCLHIDRLREILKK